VLLAHLRDGRDRILESTIAKRTRFDMRRPVQEALIRNRRRAVPA
jgi:hypothetical protein